jgi:hypothetical protein
MQLQLKSGKNVRLRNHQFCSYGNAARTEQKVHKLRKNVKFKGKKLRFHCSH